MNQNHPTPPDTQQTSALREDAGGDEQRTSSVTWGITIISAMSLILTLLGYGVALAVETSFGLPHQTVYSSVFDLVGLSVYAMISLVLGLGEITWQPLLPQLWALGIISTVGMFLFTCFLVYLRARKDRARARTDGFWRYFSAPTKHDSTGRLVGKGAIGSGLFGAFMVITPFLIAGAVMFTIVLITIVPIFGMQLGGHYFRKFVVTPTACVPVKSRTERMKLWSTPQKKTTSPVSTANCVAIFKDETKIASGRMVVATSSAVVLYEPVSGSVRRVPINELTVLPTDIGHTPSQPARGSDE